MDTKKELESLRAEIAKLRNELSILHATKQNEPKFPEAAAKLHAQNKCLLCGEKNEKKVVRGCHPKCHKRILRRIEIGELTERSAVAAGLFAPRARAGAKPIADQRLQAAIAKQLESQTSIDPSLTSETPVGKPETKRPKPQTKPKRKHG